MALQLTPTEARTFDVAGQSFDLIDLIDVATPDTLPKHTPTGPADLTIGQIVYAYGMGKFRRGVVTKIGRTRAVVAFTTRGTVDDAARYSLRTVRVSNTPVALDDIRFDRESTPEPAPAAASVEADLPLAEIMDTTQAEGTAAVTGTDADILAAARVILRSQGRPQVADAVGIAESAIREQNARAHELIDQLAAESNELAPAPVWEKTGPATWALQQAERTLASVHSYRVGEFSPIGLGGRIGRNAGTLADAQAIAEGMVAGNGRCPATGRSAGVCADQTHTECYTGHRESVALDRRLADQIP